MNSNRQLKVAQQLQRGLMPDLLPQAYPLHIGALSLPAEKVGGDFYDFIPNGPGAFDLVLGDITGHGLSAALAVALAQATFRETIEAGVEMFGYERLKAAVQQVADAEPAQIIDQLFNEILAFATGEEQSDDLTLVVVKADASYRPRVSIEPDKILAGERRPVALFCLQCLEGETHAPRPPV